MKKILITDTDNGIINNELQYILGFGASLWWIIIDSKETKIFLDARYFEKTKTLNIKSIQEKIWNTKKIIFIQTKKKLVEEMMEHIWNDDIILENNLTLKYYEDIKKKIPSPSGGRLRRGSQITISSPFFEKKRILKTKEEKEYIKKAIHIIDKVWQEIEQEVKSWKILWKTEKQMRSLIVNKILEHGWEWESFEAIVAFGENSATPHHTAGDTIIWNGPLLIDMGALYNGYCSDFTRTIWITPPNLPLSGEEKNKKSSPLTRGDWGEFKEEDYQEFQNIYNSVKKAYQKAFSFAKPWVKGKEIDAQARKSIEEDGYGEYFTHSTGHGVGLNIHEQPWISKKSKNTIQENMVFTIEPGIYLPWKFWVRLENIVFMEKNWVKCESKVSI
jgi:Xaa-Pro aminopeptidase/Xaa-Pro dipeptidase